MTFERTILPLWQNGWMVVVIVHCLFVLEVCFSLSSYFSNRHSNWTILPSFLTDMEYLSVCPQLINLSDKINILTPIFFLLSEQQDEFQGNTKEETKFIYNYWQVKWYDQSPAPYSTPPLVNQSLLLTNFSTMKLLASDASRMAWKSTPLLVSQLLPLMAWKSPVVEIGEGGRKLNQKPPKAMFGSQEERRKNKGMQFLYFSTVAAFGIRERVRNFPLERRRSLYFWRNERIHS